MISRSSYRVVSALSREADNAATHIPDSRVFVDARLQIMEDGRIDHAGA